MIHFHYYRPHIAFLCYFFLFLISYSIWELFILIFTFYISFFPPSCKSMLLITSRNVLQQMMMSKQNNKSRQAHEERKANPADEWELFRILLLCFTGFHVGKSNFSFFPSRNMNDMCVGKAKNNFNNHVVLLLSTASEHFSCRSGCCREVKQETIGTSPGAISCQTNIYVYIILSEIYEAISAQTHYLILMILIGNTSPRWSCVANKKGWTWKAN